MTPSHSPMSPAVPAAPSRAAARWQSLIPLVREWMLRELGAESTYLWSKLQREHAARVASLVTRGIPLRTIIARGLDDPRFPAAELDRRAEEVLTRRRKRAAGIEWYLKPKGSQQ